MSSKKDIVIEAIYDAIEELNDLRDDSEQIPKKMNIPLLGKDSLLDSMSLVNLIVNVEQNLEESLGIELTLANEKAMSEQRSPFQRIDTFVEYILSLLEISS